MTQIVVAMVAGEASGDLLGSHLIASLKHYCPDIHFVGIGGPQMLAQGMDVHFPMEKLAVNGYVEVLKRYREIVGIRRQLCRYLLKNPPTVFIGIDAPDFNLDLELKLRRAAIPTIHYVSPSIWAWRGERIHKIKKAVSHMLALFPHEEKIYQDEGVPVSYVGHPLADMLPMQPDKAQARVEVGLSDQAKVFAMLPGSRQSEVRQLAKTYVETAKQILQRYADAQFLVPLITREARAIFEQALKECDARQLPFTLLYGHAQAAMTAADVVLVASGTATLECALLKRPMVITYKMPALSYWIMNRKRYQPYVGLPNILAGRFVVPEILQHDATPERLAEALLNLFDNPHNQQQVLRVFNRLHERLRQNTAEKAAQAVLPFLTSTKASADG